MKHVMLVVKLHHEDDKNRTNKRFRRAMEEEGWTCVQNVSNTYQYAFSDEDDVDEAVKKSVRDATSEADATGWDAIYGVSPDEPVREKK